MNGRQRHGVISAVPRDDIDALYHGHPPPRLQDYAASVKKFGLRREDFLAIVDGMEMDVPQDIRGIDVGPSPTPYERAELLAAEAPEDIPVIIDAAALASLAYQELPDGAMKAKAKFLRDKLLNMLDISEQNVALSRTINWPNC